MDVKSLEILESKIADAKNQHSRATGALEQIRATAKKEFGVETIEEARAKESELSEQAAKLSRTYDSELLALTAEVELAVGA